MNKKELKRKAKKKLLRIKAVKDKKMMKIVKEVAKKFTSIKRSEVVK